MTSRLDNSIQMPAELTGAFWQDRSLMDYDWFPRWTHARVAVQDRIVAATLAGGRPSDRRIALYTCGTYGSGKTHALTGKTGKLCKQFRTRELVRIDPDEIRRQLPEWDELVRVDASQAGAVTHQEATFIALLAERVCQRMRLSYIVDGSLSNAEWYRDWLTQVRERGYRIFLLRFVCPIKVAAQRCDKRAQETGRTVPRELLETTYKKIPGAWRVLYPLADAWWIYSTGRECHLVGTGI
jgi:predicted ABC-type ATPase